MYKNIFDLDYEFCILKPIMILISRQDRKNSGWAYAPASHSGPLASRFLQGGSLL
jgi:hypothetical protein